MRYRQSSSNEVDISFGTGSISFKTFSHNSSPKCYLDITDIDTSKDLEGYKDSYGSLGLFLYKQVYYICFVTRAEIVANFGEDKTLFRITGVECTHVGPSLSDASQEREIRELETFLVSANFYFSSSEGEERWNACLNLQNPEKDDLNTPNGAAYNDFTWNFHMLQPILSFINSNFPSLVLKKEVLSVFIPCFCGFAQQIKIPSPPSSISIVSRIHPKRFGMKMFCRGIDDEGFVANFVETEVIFHAELEDLLMSYVIVRGSVPIFWEQKGYQFGLPQIEITRAPSATQPSFDRHLEKMKEQYKLIHILDLLRQKEGLSENLLSASFEFHLRKYSGSKWISWSGFDVYDVCAGFSPKKLERIVLDLGRELQTFGYHVTCKSSSEVMKRQSGCIRVNCFDCLDRTNKVQETISAQVIKLFLRNFIMKNGSTFSDSIIKENLSALWDANGDSISFLVAGTNSIKCSMGKLSRPTFGSVLQDLKSSLIRSLKSNPEIRQQKMIEFSLGTIPEVDRPQLFSQNSKVHVLTPATFDRIESILIEVVTWNTANVFPTAAEDFIRLVDKTKGQVIPDIIVIGLQEIVNLNASQIMTADPEKMGHWEDFLAQSIESVMPEESYSLVISQQLVGAALIIYAKNHLVKTIKNVEIASIKTGMRGMAGNKGSVAIRMCIYDKSYCFVCSHFSAGQESLALRNKDYEDAVEAFVFGGQSILSSMNFIFWFGDFNYRIDMTREEVIDLIRTKSFVKLLEQDQLRKQMSLKKVFDEFEEAKISFPPTYKYDPGTNIYDTSEKMRVPSWTDRILFHGKISPICYDRIEIDESDHKPVIGVFKCSHE